MFSNHILKPERKPLENSVWGTKKSSGTFCSLFESRLIRAKRYLNQPVEIALLKDSLGKRTTTHKVSASNPMNPKRFPTWEEFTGANQGVMILNGDSSCLSVPDASVDAVVTDPPYFDFVHYSELSDFFFAWLSPILKTRHSWFDRPDSSDIGEVQHKDPQIFARQLSKVFSECHRVLKDNGVLAFSFHHSRSEGWAAIYEAITNAGFSVVTTHPVHAELRASSSKSAANNPISLDVIIVCRKRRQGTAFTFEKNTIIEQTDFLAKQLESAGMRISMADRFVIGASKMLILASSEMLSFDQFRERLDNLQLRITPSEVEPISTMENKAELLPLAEGRSKDISKITKTLSVRG